jgi:RNA recognition motif-containing protein
MAFTNKLYVGNLSYRTTEKDLQELFEKTVGGVESVRIITDMQSGRSKGFGFVEMNSAEGAQKAIDALNGYNLHEREIVVNEARPKESKPSRGGGGGRGRGGFDRRREEDRFNR